MCATINTSRRWEFLAALLLVVVFLETRRSKAFVSPSFPLDAQRSKSPFCDKIMRHREIDAVRTTTLLRKSIARRRILPVESSAEAAEEGNGIVKGGERRETTAEERKAAIAKQINQSNYLVGSKMMTIDSFGPDYVPARSWGGNTKATSSQTAPTAVVEDKLPAVRARQAKLYEKRKWRLVGDNIFVGLLGTSGAWFVSFKAACSYGLGAALGTLYLVLLSRFVENIGKDDGGGGGGGGGAARLAIAGLLVLLVAKNREALDMIPALTGFLAYQVATLVQGVYTDFDELEDAEAFGGNA